MNREERVNELILEYVDALQFGRPLDRARFLADHSDVRPELEAFFAGHDEVERVAAPLREATGAGNHAPAPVRKPDLSEEPSGFDSRAAASRLGQLGEFRLLREIGRGGMGVVYEAEQLSLRRRVALKVLPFMAAIDPRQLQRFKNEALAAANLRHENIVAVYGVGCELGVHYYAMQLIEGQSVAGLIGELRRRDRPGTAPAPGAETQPVAPAHALETQATDGRGDHLVATAHRDRWANTRRYHAWVAGLGRQAALALEYAHQTGVVHRDVKPANLLLDPRGQLWVTDFGLAQVAGDAGITMTGEILGTLRYSSPEQARARRGLVDHRTDIYSLGATLYELLTLRPIYEGHDRHELLRQIADEEPRAPRAVDPTVPAELETIVLKALAKEPAERYATVQDFADDLSRFLDDRPILARRPTRVERLRKWTRRHPLVIGAGTALLALLTAGSLVSAALIHGERRKAEDAYRSERQRADEAEAQHRLARRSVDELFRVSEEELAENPGTEALRRRLLTSVLAYYQEFIARSRDDPGAQESLMETSRRVEKILADLAVLRAAGQLNLLSQPSVVEDLRLGAEQRAQVKVLSDRVARQWKESFDDFGRVSAAERGRRALEKARTNEADLKAALTPEQLRRLHQIGLQVNVPASFREPEVAAVIELTDEQRSRLRIIEDEGWLDLFRTFRPNMGPPARDPNPKPPKHERILKLLTDEQARKWREITGAPFNGPIPLPHPFPGH